MKRYASHFLFLPEYGYLKQHVIEMEEEHVFSISPLTEETENTEWFPGVIALLRYSEQSEESDFFDKSDDTLSAVPQSIEKELPFLIPYLFYHFDFTTMRPVAETRRRQLR